MDCGNKLYTNTYYFMYLRSYIANNGEYFGYNDNYRKIFVGKWGKLDHYKLCFGNYKDNVLGYKFRFRISGDDSVVHLNTLDKVGIDFKDYDDNDCAWLSMYGDYVKTTSSWSKASWFVIEKSDKDCYKIHIKNNENSYFRHGESSEGEVTNTNPVKGYENTFSTRTEHTSIGYINSNGSKEKADLFDFSKV